MFPMKFFKPALFVLFVLFAVFAFCGLHALGIDFADSVSGSLIAMSIPISGLYTNQSRLIGELTEHHPAPYTRTGFAKADDVLFGHALMLVDNGDFVNMYSDKTLLFAGVSVRSPEASGYDTDRYMEGDVVGCNYTGIIAAMCEEAVNPTSTVRIRHTDHASDVTKTKGQFCTTAENGKTAVLKGAEFRSTISAKGIVELYLSGNFEVIPDEA
jgi:hypothetical protein